MAIVVFDIVVDTDIQKAVVNYSVPFLKNFPWGQKQTFFFKRGKLWDAKV
jgi:hypothetical protein